MLLGKLVPNTSPTVILESLAQSDIPVEEQYRDRRAFVESAVAMVRERPGMGFGLGNFENGYPAFARVDMAKTVDHAHNDWAEWGAEGGLVFLGLMVALGVWVVPGAVRTVWGVGVVAVMVHALVDFPLHAPAMEFWVFVMMGLVVEGGKVLDRTI